MHHCCSLFDYFIFISFSTSVLPLRDFSSFSAPLPLSFSAPSLTRSHGEHFGEVEGSPEVVGASPSHGTQLEPVHDLFRA